MKHATLHQLKIFKVVARHLNFTRAADELFLTQPTVSIQMKQLADTVGLPLLEQVGKRTYLTDIGRELLTVCLHMFEDIAQFEMLVADMKGVKAGKLRLCVVTTAQYFVPRLLGAFCEQYPGIDITLKVSNRERLLLRMLGNEDDLYILGQSPDHVDAWVKPFLDNPLVVLASSSHPLAGQIQIPLARISQEPILMREPGSGTRLATENFFYDHGLQINLRMELGSDEAIKQAVAGGLGVAVLSAHTLALERHDDELTVLDVVDFPILRQWHVAHTAGKQLSVVASTFLEFLQRESAPLAERYMQNFPGFNFRRIVG